MTTIEATTQQIEGAKVHTLLLNRPQRANALDASTVEDLHGHVRAAEAENVNVIVFTSTTRTFCGGLDLTGLDDETDATLLYRLCRIELLLERIRRAPYLTIARLNGPAVGAGADLAMACHRRYASGPASVRFPGTAFGAVLGVRRLAELCPADLAAWIALSGQEMDARTAAQHGLWELIDDGAWPAELANLSRLAISQPVGTISQVTSSAKASMIGSDPLGELVRSVAGEPGLRDRLRLYRDHRNPSL